MKQMHRKQRSNPFDFKYSGTLGLQEVIVGAPSVAADASTGGNHSFMRHSCGKHTGQPFHLGMQLPPIST